MNKFFRHLLLLSLTVSAIFLSCTPSTSTAPPAPAATVQLIGVNRAGAEYGDDWDGWTGQTYYEWPTTLVRTNELDFYKSNGMNSVRLPISWERLQHTLGGPLDSAYQTKMVEYVNDATSRGFKVVLDLHNYGRYAVGAYDSSGKQVSTYKKQVLGDGVLTFAHISDVWTKLSQLFSGNQAVIFNIMNEQHDADPRLSSTDVFSGYQTVLNAIRATGAKNLVLFPNTRSSDTHHWSTWLPQRSGPLDSVAALAITDSANNLAFDMHSYQSIDSWNSDIIVVTEWAKTNKKKLFMSELGTTSGSAGIATLLSYMNANSDVWLGWTAWNLDPYTFILTNRTSGVVAGTAKFPWFSPYLVVVKQQIVCTYTYSDWSPCQSNSMQTRTVASSPADCVAGSILPLTQSCTYVPPDTDGDGVLDDVDKCPTVKGIKTSNVDTSGCLPLVVTATVTSNWGTGYCKQFIFKNPNPIPMSWTQMTIYLKDGKLRGATSVWGAVFPDPNKVGTIVVTPLPATSVVKPGETLKTVGFCADFGISKYIGTSGGLKY